MQAALHLLVVAVVVEGQELVQDVDASLRADREAGALRGLVEAVAEIDLPPGRQRRGRDPVLELADLRLALLVEGVGLADRLVDLDVDLAEMDDVGIVVRLSLFTSFVELGEAHVCAISSWIARNDPVHFLRGHRSVGCGLRKNVEAV